MAGNWTNFLDLDGPHSPPLQDVKCHRNFGGPFLSELMVLQNLVFILRKEWFSERFLWIGTRSTPSCTINFLHLQFFVGKLSWGSNPELVKRLPNNNSRFSLKRSHPRKFFFEEYGQCFFKNTFDFFWGRLWGYAQRSKRDPVTTIYETLTSQKEDTHPKG